MKQALTITRKELRSYFGSPMALIFIAAFLAATLFSFFWVETFFARGIADVRPLFKWMPILLIFLVAALTMRQWSEEQRSGTLEVLLTLPVSTVQLVIGKFLAVVALVAIALALTLFLPLTVELLGNLDWGPVFGGYLASLLLAAAYAAIGLFVSSRTDNQIVALITTVLLCGVFYLVGSSAVVAFVGNELGVILRAIGAGSRFESIQRGVIDLRDLLYYLSLAGIFLTLNVLSLKAKGWSEGDRTLPKRRAVAVTSALVILNLLLVNVWAYPLSRLRVDLTENREYTLSETTRDLLAGLSEPLLIRGYFSEKTHPLLAPLVPAVQDMLQEYAIAGETVQVEIVDPAKFPEKEAEASQVYGINPTPFQVSGRYEASIINSYFDILIQYGDQSATLSYGDLIEVTPSADGSVSVKLRNLEYDLTSTIKRVAYGFQSVDSVLAALPEPAQMTVYITPNTLPESLAEAPAVIEGVLQDIAAKSSGKFSYALVDPDAAGSSVSRQELYDQYGLQPLSTSLFSVDSYYLHMLLVSGDQAQLVYPSGELSEAGLRTAIESALKRLSPGFLQVVGLWTPPAETTVDAYGQTQQAISSWDMVASVLQQEYEVQTVDLTTGVVAPEIDVLVVIGPQGLDEASLYAIDQFLMRGGTVVLAAGSMGIELNPYGGLGAKQVSAGVAELLTHYGITIEPSLVLDSQNEPFPLPVVRQVGDYQVQEIKPLNYPFFLDIRPDAMAEDHPIVSSLAAVTLNWASPITVDPAKNTGREVTAILRSSAGAWTLSDFDIEPDLDAYPEYGFPPMTPTQSYTVAVTAVGVFESYFKGKAAPVVSNAQGAEAVAAAGTLESSPGTARLVVFGSFEFVDDTIMQLSQTLRGENYLNSLQLLQNAVAWAVEDTDLLGIRSRGTAARVLVSMTEQEQSFWEVANYVVGLVSLAGVGAVASARRRGEQPLDLEPVGISVEPDDESGESGAASQQEVA